MAERLPCGKGKKIDLIETPITCRTMCDTCGFNPNVHNARLKYGHWQAVEKEVAGKKMLLDRICFPETLYPKQKGSLL